MRIHIEVNPDLQEEELVIRCKAMDGRARRVEQFVRDVYAPMPTLAYSKGAETFYFPLEDVLFFEAEGEHVYAHTAKDMFLVKQRLYTLERELPRWFVRAAKGALLNVRHVYSIEYSIRSVSLVRFANSHKQLYVSRLYQKEVRQRLDDERSRL